MCLSLKDSPHLALHGCHRHHPTLPTASPAPLACILTKLMDPNSKGWGAWFPVVPISQKVAQDKSVLVEYSQTCPMQGSGCQHPELKHQAARLLTLCVPTLMMADEPQTTAPYSYLLHPEPSLLGRCLKKKKPRR